MNLTNEVIREAKLGASMCQEDHITKLMFEYIIDFFEKTEENNRYCSERIMSPERMKKVKSSLHRIQNKIKNNNEYPFDVIKGIIEFELYAIDPKNWNINIKTLNMFGINVDMEIYS